MVPSILAVAFGAAMTVVARHTPRSTDQPLVHLHDLVPRGVTYSTLEQDSTGRVPYFAYEEKSLSRNESLPQLFMFGSNLTNSHPSNTFQGPGNCKVFPGDEKWPSWRDWTALDHITGNALLKPTPQAHICYGIGTSNASQSVACLDLTKGWSDPFTQ
jgi:hypothetical protein